MKKPRRMQPRSIAEEMAAVWQILRQRGFVLEDVTDLAALKGRLPEAVDAALDAAQDHLATEQRVVLAGARTLLTATAIYRDALESALGTARGDGR